MAFFSQKLLVKVGPKGLFLMTFNPPKVSWGIGTKFESIKVKRLPNKPYDLACSD